MTAWLVAAIAALAGCSVSLWLRYRLARIEAERDAHRRRADSLEADVAEMLDTAGRADRASELLRREIAELEETLGASTDPAAVRDRLRRLLSDPASPDA